MPINFGSIAEIASAIIAAVGFFFAVLELRRSTKNQRAQFLLDTTQRYFGDENVRKLYYELDYREIYIVFKNNEPTEILRPTWPAQPFIPSDEERCLDLLLYTLDTIGRVFELGTLTQKEAEIFSFQARRVLSHPSVADYVKWVSDARKTFGGAAPAFYGAYVLAEFFGPVIVDSAPRWVDEKQDKSK